MDNADGRDTWGHDHDGKAVGGEDTQRKLWSIGDQAISGSPSYLQGITGLVQHDNVIAVDLAQRHEGTGIDSDRPSKARPILFNA
jgi:hypothetical protein